MTNIHTNKGVNMTRTIKFRAWFAPDKQMIDWKTLSFRDDNGISDWGIDVISGKDGWFPMQFTGLKDKNGVEIYEGDVVMLSEVLGVKNFITDIFYENGAFVYRHGDGSGSLIPRSSPKPIGEPEVKVIGNIYEYEGLLDKEDSQ